VSKTDVKETANMKKSFGLNNESEIIKSINKLYITKRSKYLLMNEDGEYVTVKSSLTDNILKQHLIGKKTIGIFSGEHLTKCLIFDVDITDKQESKWICYKIRNQLIEFGFPQDQIYISFSGNKGYHISIHSSEPFSFTVAKEIYEATLREISLLHKRDKIELRPQPNLGVKLPLGINKKNKDSKNNICYFCDFTNGLKIIKDKTYILKMEPISSDDFNNIIERMKDNDYIFKGKISEEDVIQEKESLEESYKQPDSFSQNVDENETIEAIQDLLLNGLQFAGSRNNSVLKIAKLFNYYGLPLEECIEQLKDWMKWQDKSLYTTPIDKCMSEIERIGKYVYKNNITLTVEKKDVSIPKGEITEIMKLQLNTHKLVLYSLLVQSKRYSTKNGSFYMAYSQMSKSTGIQRSQLINIITKLEKDGFIDIISRNERTKGSAKSKANKYKIKFNIELNNEHDFIIEKDFNDNLNNKFMSNVCLLFTNKELRTICNKRQYQQFKSYRKSIAA
jgi:hypothetical protein